MTPYLDAGFLLTLFTATGATSVASQIVRQITEPIALNSLHFLQVECFLGQQLRSEDAKHRLSGAAGERTWKYYLAEGFFVEADVEWSRTFILARHWNRSTNLRANLPLLLLHPALAVLSDSTHFLSFDLRSRAVAQLAGLKLLPHAL